MAVNITLDELLAEYARLDPPTTEAAGLTVSEFSALWGCGPSKVVRILRRAKMLGTLRLGEKQIEQLNGLMRKTTCYWFEFPKDSKKPKK